MNRSQAVNLEDVARRSFSRVSLFALFTKDKHLRDFAVRLAKEDVTTVSDVLRFTKVGFFKRFSTSKGVQDKVVKRLRQARLDFRG
jgi:hypothetical protein